MLMSSLQVAGTGRVENTTRLLPALAATIYRFTLNEQARLYLNDRPFDVVVDNKTLLGDAFATEVPSPAEEKVEIYAGLHLATNHDQFTLLYDPTKHDQETANAIYTSFHDILTDWDHQSCLSNLHFPSARDQLNARGLLTFSEIPFPRDTGIGDLFHRSATRNPTLSALISDDGVRELTYAELDNRSDIVAHWLISLGLSSESAVGIWVENTLEYPVAVLGVLKAGLACLPLDPRSPISYVRQALQDCSEQQDVPVIHPGFSDISGFYEITSTSLSEILSGSWPMVDTSCRATGNSLAYFCVTSGSTGRPKAIMINHHTLARVSFTPFARCGTCPAPGQIWTNLSNNAWSFAQNELFSPLLNGATVVPIPHEKVIDLPILASIFKSRAVNVSFMVPALVAALCRDYPSALKDVSMLVLSGDIAQPDDVKVARAAFSGHLINTYGSSETHFTTGYFCPTDEDLGSGTTVPIGTPWPNISAYVLDNQGRYVPPGMPGTFYIAGEFLARGYKDPKLNEGAFFLSTASHLSQGPGSKDGKDKRRFFCSSDQCRWLPRTGQLEFLRRNDAEVKLRGQRIDLPTVEHLLRLDHRVSQATCLILSDPRDEEMYLVAFLVLAEFHQAVGLNIQSELHQRLVHSLPSFMVPSYIHVLSSLPRLANDKIDRRGLGTWWRENVVNLTTAELDDGEYSATQKLVVRVFRHVLKRQDIGLSTSFFEFGGHSLNATRVISRIKENLGINGDASLTSDRSLSVKTIFEAPTPAALAQIIDDIQLNTPAVSGQSAYQRIPHINSAELCPLSFAQERLYFFETLHPNQLTYVLPTCYRLSGRLDVVALQNALNELRRRHEMLRVTFQELNGRVLQRVHAFVPLDLPVIFLSEESLQGQLVEDNSRTFDLHHDHPFRFKLYKIREDCHILWMCLHHISTDAWSDGILLRELGILYSAFRQNRSFSLPKPSITYVDYAAWQRQEEQVRRQEEQLIAWLRVLKGSIPAEFPPDMVRPPILSPKAGVETLDITGLDALSLEHLASQIDATPFIILLSVLRVLHYRLTGIEDATIGNPIANRHRVEVEDVVGFFVNTQCMRLPLEGSLSFKHFCERVRDVAIAAYAAQDVAFERIVHQLQPIRDLSRNPIVQVMIAVHPDEDIYFNDDVLSVESLPVEPVTRFDLELHFVKRSDDQGYRGRLIYSRDLYTVESAQRLVKQFRALLEQAISADLTIDDFQLPDALASLHKLGLLTDNSSSYPKDAALGSLFRASALQHASRTAVRDESTSFTYAELDAVSDRIAHCLASRRLPGETAVGLYCHRSALYVACIIGIIKAGLSYLPLDPQLPPERLLVLLNDVNSSSIIFCAAELESTFRSISEGYAELKVIESVLTVDTNQGSFEPTSHVDGRSLAYAMYTSGSTGRPKRVLIEHRSVTRLAFDNAVVTAKPGQVWAHISNPAFDSSTWEIWVPLLNGGTVVCFDRMTILDFNLLATKFHENEVQIAFLTTALAAKCLHEAPSLLSTLDVLATGGEICEPTDLTKMSALVRGYVAHVYGPTESTTYATVYRVPRLHQFAGIVPIGRPLLNTSAFILDSKQRLLPAGVVGDLYLGGDGLARGYGDTAQTLKAFVTVPIDGVKRRLYITGDRARWNFLEGKTTKNYAQMEFLGRKDNQIKLRGQRVELGEIEHILRSHPLVKSAAAILHDVAQSEKSIAAFIVPHLELVTTHNDIGKVEEWGELFNDETYTLVGEVSHDQVGRDFVGWMKMLDGEVIPRTEMEEWLQDTVRGILGTGSPGNVVEIGVGTGMMLFNLKDQFLTYTGLDPSPKAVQFVNGVIDTDESLKRRASVQVGTAADLLKLGLQSPDLFILNSVTQYFPNAGYLETVITDAIAATEGKPARIFLGDIRSFALSDEFFASFAFHQLQKEVGTNLDLRSIHQRSRSLRGSHRELLLDPLFFFNLQETIPGISHVEILPKRMAASNELSKFRYQVVLWIHNPNLQVCEVSGEQWHDYDALGWDLTDVRRAALALSPGEFLAIRNIPNSSLSWERQLLNASASGTWLEELGNSIEPNTALSAFDLHHLSQELSLPVTLSWARQRQECAMMDAVFSYNQTSPLIVRFPPPPSTPLTTNQPGQISKSQSLDVEELREFLSSRLPSYMVPTTLRIIDDIPVTVNGKTDRRALDKHLVELPRLETVVQPQNATEEAVLSIFREVLNKDPISTLASFFDIGGHSLLATRVVSRLRKNLNVPLTIRDLFNQPNARDLANIIDKKKAEHGGKIFAPIPNMTGNDPTPLSFSQARLMFLDQLNPGNNWWFINLSFRITGDLDVVALSSAVNDLRYRHENLRSVFPTTDLEPKVEVLDFLPQDLPTCDFSLATDPEHEFTIHFENHRQKSFDLATEAPFRTHLYKLGRNSFVFSLTMHHIIYDGHSLEIIKRELGALYSHHIGHATANLPPLPIQFRDYAVWQRQPAQEAQQTAQLHYWIKELSGVGPAEFPPDFLRPPVLKHAAGIKKFTIGSTIRSQIAEIAANHGLTAFMVLLAAFRLLHYRFSGTPDALVGILNGNRSREEIEGIVGFFVDTQAIRVPVHDDLSFVDLLQATRNAVTMAFEHQDISFDKVVSALHPARDLSRNPLVQVVFALHPFNYDFAGILPTLTTVPIEPHHTTRMDLELHIYEKDQHSYEGQLLFNTSLYSKAYAENLCSAYLELLLAALTYSMRPVTSLSFTNAAGLLQSLDILFRDDSTPLKNLTVVDLFRQTAARFPDNTAIIDQTGTYTYRDLEAASNKIAGALIASIENAYPEQTVGIFAQRSAMNVMAIYGVLKAGLAYVPFDPELPPARLESLLRDSFAPKVFLKVDSQSLPNLEAPGSMIISVEAILQEPQNVGHSTPLLIKPDSLAYIMYTSGSAGKPKGVMVEHRGIVRLVHKTNITDIQPGQSVAHLSALSFDAATFEIFSTLSNGGTLVTIDRITLLSPDALTAFAVQHKIEIAYMTSALFSQFVRTNPSFLRILELVVTGGDVVEVRDVLEAYRLGVKRIIDAFGPTEDTVWSTFYEVPPTKTDFPRSIPIGKSISYSRAYVVDSNMQLVPPAVIGELVLAGDVVARGYTDPEQTRKAFVYISINGLTTRIYRTGDRARVNPMDGNIEFLGRIDNQIKLRGQRIELGEIEQAIRRHSAVEDVAVILHSDKEKEKRIVAFVILSDNGPPTKPVQLRKHVSSLLPAYMVPSVVHVIQDFPLTTATKVDRTALSKLFDSFLIDNHENPDQDDAFAPLNGWLEETVCSVFCGALPVSVVGAEDSFFDLGGHSLLAVSVALTLSACVGVPVSVRDLYQSSTPRALASQIEAKMTRKVEEGITSLGPCRTWIKKVDDRQTLALIHDGFGLTTPYRSLMSHLDLNLVGFNDPYFASDGFQSVSAMAKHYADLLMPLVEDHAFVLGWSFGGTIAAELAILLEDKCIPVTLILVDAPNVSASSRVAERESSIDEFVARQSYPDSLAQCLKFEVRKNVSLLKNHRLSRQLSNRTRIFSLKATKHPDYPDRELTEGDGELFDERNGWGNELGETWTTIRIDGSHFELFKEPQVQEVASAIAQVFGTE